jgi:hypothetical protein
METLAAKKAILQEAAEGRSLVLLEHDPRVAAGYLSVEDGKRRLIPAVPQPTGFDDGKP